MRYLRPPARRWRRPTRCRRESRTNIWVNFEEFPGLAGRWQRPTCRPASPAHHDLPIIVERAMYLDRPGSCSRPATKAPASPRRRRSGSWPKARRGRSSTCSCSSPTPATPPRQVDGDVSCCRTARRSSKTYTVAATSRFNIWVDQEGRGARRHGGVDDDPLDQRRAGDRRAGDVVARDGRASGTRRTTRRARRRPGRAGRWPKARSAARARVDTYILLANTSPTAGTVKVTLLFEDGTSAEQTFTVVGHSRFNVDVRTEFPAAADRRFGAIVEAGRDAGADRRRARDVLGCAWTSGGRREPTRSPPGFVRASGPTSRDGECIVPAGTAGRYRPNEGPRPKAE